MSPSDNLETVCLRTTTKYNMLDRGDSLVVGVSGGADSVALLHFLHGLAGEWELTLMAAHLNHNLRGDESDRDEAFVRDLCRDLKVLLEVESRPVGEFARQRGLSVEECARDERYRFFGALAEKRRAKIATAHTLDDSAETVLLNLTRGTALRGLCGIPPVRDRIVRPLIGCTREQVERYCEIQGLAYVTDSTNLSDRYTRNRLRHQVLPVLQEINPAVLSLVGSMTETLRADADCLDALAAAQWEKTHLGDGCMDASLLRGLAPSIRLRVVARLLEERQIPVDRHRLDQVDRLLKEDGQAQLSARWLCRCRCGKLRFLPPPEESAEWGPIPLPHSHGPQQISILPGKSLRIAVVNGDNYKKNINNLQNQFKNGLDCAKIGRIVELRQRRAGDRIRLAGRGCTKDVRKLYNEAGLCPRSRQRTIVLAGDSGPLWVEGFGVAEHVAPGPGTRQVLLLEVEET